MKKEKRQHGFWFHLFDVLLNIVIIVAIVGLTRQFLMSPFQVEGNSMNDTLLDRQYIVINKFGYLIGDPQRGDVVVFHPAIAPGTYYVKRVIGLPGDTVIIKDGNVFLQKAGDAQAHELNEDYLNDHNRGMTFRHPPSGGDRTEIDYRVPAGQYFVLGDNRQGSLDSRSFTADNPNVTPFVERSQIKGKVWFVALPITKIHAIAPPNYN